MLLFATLVAACSKPPAVMLHPEDAPPDRLSDWGVVLADGQVLAFITSVPVRYEDGWQALPYVWNEAQDEAFLELAGDVRSIRLNDGGEQEQFVYVVPDVNQCGGCHKPDHTAAELRPLGSARMAAEPRVPLPRRNLQPAAALDRERHPGGRARVASRGCALDGAG